ncbi:MAG: AAA family ATPase, partial [Leptospiraceae bacterium]|nr:AAA family ATPase [Leptospiraceae bacterium]
MLKQVELKIGNTNQKELNFEPGTMNVIVGPNHSGKSRLLLEIKSYIESFSKNKNINFNTRYAPISKENLVILKSLQIRIQEKGNLRQEILNRLYKIVIDIKNDENEKIKQTSQWIDFLVEANINEKRRAISSEKDSELSEIEKANLEKLKERIKKFIKKYGVIYDYLEGDVLKWKPLLKWMNLFSEEELSEIEEILNKVIQELKSNDIKIIFQFLEALSKENFSQFILKILDKDKSVLLKNGLDFYVEKIIRQANQFLDQLESLSLKELLNKLLQLEIIDINTHLDLCADYMLYINGANRFEYAKGWPASEIKLNQKPNKSNHFVQFLHPDYFSRREKFRTIIHAIFGYYPVFDQRDLKNIYLRFSEKHPEFHETRFQEKESMEFLEKECIPIDYFSDGIRSLSGILAKVLSDEYDLILIDEPDAFLYPPLARKFGKLLTEYTSELDGNTFVATHSPEFLMGCI